MAREPTRGYALSTGIEIDPCDPLYLENREAFLLHAVDEALQQCDRVLAVTPHDVDALLRKAALHLGPYLNDRFLDYLENGVLLSRDESGELVRQPEVDVTQKYVATYWASHTSEHFCGLFTVPDVDPKCGESLFWIDNPSRGAGALALLDTAVDADPTNLKALWWKGFVLYRSGRFADAVDSYDRMLQLDADDERTWLAKAACFERLQQFNGALECYDQVLECGVSGQGLTEMANILVEVGRLEEAMECYDQMLDAGARFGPSRFMKGYILTMWGEYEEALEYVSEACEGIVWLDALIFRPYLRFKTGDTLGASRELADMKRSYPNRFVERATNLKKVVCDIDYRRLVERIDADAAPERRR